MNALFGVADVTRLRSDTNRSPLGTSVLYGRLLTEPASVKKPADLSMMRDFSFEPRHAAACAIGAFYGGGGRIPPCPNTYRYSK